MNKILTSILLLTMTITLNSCTKTQYMEDYIYVYDTTYVYEHHIDTLYISNKEYCLADELVNGFIATDCGPWKLGFEDLEYPYITESDKYPNYNKLCFRHQLTLKLIELTYDYRTGITTYDTIRYWRGNIKENPSKTFNYLISIKGEDIVECRREDRDTIIEIHCPHQEITHRWYYVVYHK